MVQFDSPVVEALVSRACTPMDAGAVNAEVVRALSEMELSHRDRGQLLMAQFVLLQGSLSGLEAGVLVDEAISLLRQGSNIQSLLSALSIRATLAAAERDHATCLEHCLTVSGIIRANPDNAMSFRAAVNFGAALMVLGAYDLAAPLFANAIEGCLDSDEMTGVVVSCANLVMAISRRMLVMGQPVIVDAENQERLKLVEAALHEVDQRDPGQEMRAFVQAVLADSAQIRGDSAAAELHWGELDALTAHSSASFTQYLCLVEAPLAIDRGEFERAHVLIQRALDYLPTPHIVPLGRVDALKLRSILHERTGDLEAAIVDAREAASLALNETKGAADLLIGQIDKRAALEHSQKALLDQANHLSEQALVDELSRVGNRRAYDTQITSLRGAPEATVAVLVLDIDRFKYVNDQFGHTFGDEVIARTAQIAMQVCGLADRVFRYGGDEFVLLISALSTEDAVALAERVRRTFENEPWATPTGQRSHITCSVGVWSGSTQDIDVGLTLADAQLYEAKRAGRNTVRAAAAPIAEPFAFARASGLSRPASPRGR